MPTTNKPSEQLLDLVAELYECGTPEACRYFEAFCDAERRHGPAEQKRVGRPRGSKNTAKPSPSTLFESANDEPLPPNPPNTTDGPPF